MKTETFLEGRVALHCGDCLEALAEMPEASVDSVVTDPPYHLSSMSKPQPVEGVFNAYNRRQVKMTGFMGKNWDGGDIAFRPETWAAVLRVLKPGGHLVAFGAPRNYHRMACAIEDAGAEIRDSLMWVFGSGFPKSHDVSKAIDRAAGAEREVVGSYAVTREFQGRDYVASASHATTVSITAPATDAAKQWQGWGSALKPCYEPILLCRKPLIGTIAENVLRHGTGGLNIDGCRVQSSDAPAKWETPRGGIWSTDSNAKAELIFESRGRWPGNLLHDGSEEVLAGFPERKSAGEYTESKKLPPRSSDAFFGKGRVAQRDNSFAGESGSAARFFASFPPEQPSGRWPGNLLHDGSEEVLAGFPESSSGEPRQPTGSRQRQSGFAMTDGGGGFGDSGSAARFFASFPFDEDQRRFHYDSKAGSDDRLGSSHPTIKPISLIRWLARLVTPPGGKILDPFAGTGTLGEAAYYEGFSAILIEREEAYQADIRKRMALVLSGPDERRGKAAKQEAHESLPLFGGQAA